MEFDKSSRKIKSLGFVKFMFVAFKCSKILEFFGFLWSMKLDEMTGKY